MAIMATGWFRFRDHSREEVARLQEEVTTLRSFRDRLDGASVLSRMADLESRQRSTDTAMARVEARLTSIDTLLEQIAGNVQQLITRGGDG